MLKQECIPVGCVPPAHYRNGGVSVRHPLDRDSPWTAKPLDREPPNRDPLPGQTPWTETPSPVDRQTPVKR